MKVCYSEISVDQELVYVSAFYTTPQGVIDEMRYHRIAILATLSDAVREFERCYDSENIIRVNFAFDKNKPLDDSCNQAAVAIYEDWLAGFASGGTQGNNYVHRIEASFYCEDLYASFVPDESE